MSRLLHHHILYAAAVILWGLLTIAACDSSGRRAAMLAERGRGDWYMFHLKYDYTYDSLGRLTSSHYSSSVSGTTGRFDESVSYNPNGSITSLLRGGMKNNGTFGVIDDLTVI